MFRILTETNAIEDMTDSVSTLTTTADDHDCSC